VRLLVVHPGASASTHDVYVGLTRALERQGHEIIPYLLDGRIDSMGGWLNWQWKKAGKPDPKPTSADILYLAGTPVFERALRTLPDWVIVISAMYVHPDVLIMLRRLGVPTAYVFTESPYDLKAETRVAPYADVVFTNERSCVDTFREVNKHSYYLPHAYDPERHYPRQSLAMRPVHDVVFVGTGFQERIELLSAVNWDGIDLGLYGSWSLMGSRSKLRRYVRSTVPISNAETSALYRSARIGLNLYRTSMGFGRDAPRIARADSLNPRAYELAACGVFQVCDWRPEVDEMFGGTVCTFTDAAVLEDCIRWALEHEDHRRDWAAQAMKLVRHETFDERAKYLTQKLDTVARDRALRIQSRDGINPRAAVPA
jgi:spore maturation protein CgeB